MQAVERIGRDYNPRLPPRACPSAARIPTDLTPGLPAAVTRDPLTPRKGGKGAGSNSATMKVGELAKRVGRSVDTLKRWEQQALLTPARDNRGRRIFREEDVAFCLHLAELSIAAQRRSQKLKVLAADVPVQLNFGLEVEH